MKDLIDVEGMRRSEGSRLQLTNVSEASPDYIVQLERAGLVIAGKTNTPGVPIGSMLTAAPGADGLLYELAFALEEARPWAHRWAPHSAMFAGTRFDDEAVEGEGVSGG